MLIKRVICVFSHLDLVIRLTQDVCLEEVGVVGELEDFRAADAVRIGRGELDCGDRAVGEVKSAGEDGIGDIEHAA